MGLNSLKESQQSSARVFPMQTLSSGGIKKLADNASSDTALSSTSVRLPTPAKTMFLQNYPKINTKTLSPILST
jgi:hypothetical protein